MFCTFLSFCVFVQISIHSLYASNLLAFLAFMVYDHFTSSAMTNHMSGIKTKCSMWSLDTSLFNDSRIKYFTKAITLTDPLKISLKAVIDIPLLHQIVSQCDDTFMGQVFKAAYLLSCFSFLRISSLIPHSIHSFDPNKQLARADVFLLLQGSYTHMEQDNRSQEFIQDFEDSPSGASPTCPVQAVKNLLLITPPGRNKPLFQMLRTRSPLHSSFSYYTRLLLGVGGPFLLYL